MSKQNSVFSPCSSCYNYFGCCGCSKHMEWDKWKKSLSDEDWNNEVIREMNNKIAKIQEKYHKLLK